MVQHWGLERLAEPRTAPPGEAFVSEVLDQESGLLLLLLTWCNMGCCQETEPEEPARCQCPPLAASSKCKNLDSQPASGSG